MPHREPRTFTSNLGESTQHQACVSPKLQRNHNSSVLKILQIIPFVFNILQIDPPISGLFRRLCTNRYRGGTSMSAPIPDLKSRPDGRGVILAAFSQR
jgi:hypothetical protein